MTLLPWNWLKRKVSAKESIVTIINICEIIGMKQALEAPGPAEIVAETRPKNCSEAL